MSGRGKVSEERELSLWTELTEEALWKTESLSSTLKKVIRGKLGEEKENWHCKIEESKKQKPQSQNEQSMFEIWWLLLPSAEYWLRLGVLYIIINL